MAPRSGAATRARSLSRWLGPPRGRRRRRAGGDGIPLGAAWYRLFAQSDRGNGILAPRGVPELSIAVVPEHRGRHIGRELLTALARTAKADGLRHLMLSVDPDNVRAVRLYERAGFVLVDSADPARGTSLIMQLDL